jgi:hypothetical protein
MPWRRNLLGHNSGIWRSIGGAADEQAFLGKATGAGFHVFFKVWRDMPYDAVLDYQGELFRIEVKGTGGNSLDLTRGGRTGTQINRAIPSRKRPINSQDCDFTAGIYTAGTSDSTCYIIPAEVIEILSFRATAGGFSLSRLYLEHFFKEKWDLLTGGSLGLPVRDIKMGFRMITQANRQALLTRLGVARPISSTYKVPNSRRILTNPSDIESLLIWQNLGA